MAKPALAAMLDGMRLFKLGFSWGGYESLIIPFDPRAIRTATPLAGLRDPACACTAGLESADDLIEDLEQGFGRLRG